MPNDKATIEQFKLAEALLLSFVSDDDDATLEAILSATRQAIAILIEVSFDQ